VVVDPSPDEAQAESSNAINRVRKPARTACLITNNELIRRYPGCKQACSVSAEGHKLPVRGAMSCRLISAPMCSALVKLAGLEGWTLLRRVFSSRSRRSHSLGNDSLLLGGGTGGNQTRRRQRQDSANRSAFVHEPERTNYRRRCNQQNSRRSC
jgi:hypothetical protein